MLQRKNTSSESHLSLPGPCGDIQAVLNLPKDDAEQYIAIVCHPHPLYDGTMNNKVTFTLARSFTREGMLALRFNFRGVGESAGEYADGEGELADLLAVFEYVKRVYPQRKICLAGFSFGAYIAIKAARTIEPELLITVAPPVNFFDFSAFARPTAETWVLIQGDCDEVVPHQKVLHWVDTLVEPPELITMEGAGHFFHKRLTDLADIVEEQIANLLERAENLA